MQGGSGTRFVAETDIEAARIGPDRRGCRYPSKPGTFPFVRQAQPLPATRNISIATSLPYAPHPVPSIASLQLTFVTLFSSLSVTLLHSAHGLTFVFFVASRPRSMTSPPSTDAPPPPAIPLHHSIFLPPQSPRLPATPHSALCTDSASHFIFNTPIISFAFPTNLSPLPHHRHSIISITFL